MTSNPSIAYFSAEIGLQKEIPTYSGGLGILAGDTIKAMADLSVPLCAVTLLYTRGNFIQTIKDQVQEEEFRTWDFKNYFEDTNREVSVNISGEHVKIKIWKYSYEGVSKHQIPIYFLDTNVDGNSNHARMICDKLYIGDRLAQEIVLGIGGVRALHALGHDIKTFHMNEGHSALLTLELYKTLGEKLGWDDGHVKERCVFTTHTPVPAGHDRFEYYEVEEKLKGEDHIIPLHIKQLAGEEKLNMTELAMSFSRYTNAVSKKHGEVTREMFPDFTIDSITNGIHAKTWVSHELAELYGKYIPNWEHSNEALSDAFRIPNSEIFKAHRIAKKRLIDYTNANSVTGATLNYDCLTIGYARRFAAYKDADFIFKNLDNLRRLGKKVQFIFAGKAHASDGLGKEIMSRVIKFAKELQDDISIAFLEEYNMEVGKLMTSGCDLWLNTPVPFNEASGTSGMKAAVNGVLHLSRLDGWAIESYEMNGGGFPIQEYSDFITKLEYKLIPSFYSTNKTSWIEEMKLAIGNAGSYFNTHRMAKEYLKKAYKL